jgi:hypothetical protein
MYKIEPFCVDVVQHPVYQMGKKSWSAVRALRCVQFYILCDTLYVLQSHVNSEIDSAKSLKVSQPVPAPMD